MFTGLFPVGGMGVSVSSW